MAPADCPAVVFMPAHDSVSLIGVIRLIGIFFLFWPAVFPAGSLFCPGPRPVFRPSHVSPYGFLLAAPLLSD
ncbi:hypothetical protein DCO56_19895 [Sphingobacterium athyrii]|uniref:Uncharacterized protein n=1 Tax=Sphingobacterium athyrii TaxID=2152717 RepID=A0A363NR87_9SPHI|nr:hypothetical protein DCO56_19895 [Sphingobacterium athyrii]